jgi:GR25 family glycosyltransferase involved in LPS biosynthesis
MYVIATPNSVRVDYFKKSEILNQLFSVTYVEAIMLDESTLEKYVPSQIDPNYANAIYGRTIRAAEFGCALSSNIARTLASSQHGSVIVEDDARFFEPNETYLLVNEFLEAHAGSPHILSLYDGRLATGKLKRLRIRRINRIIGMTAGAVAYVLTKEAALELSKSNTPVRYLNDWPPTNCKYFVCHKNLVNHGDFESTISDNVDFRVRNGFTRQVQVFLFMDYLRNNRNIGSFRNYLEKGWLPRVKNYLGNFQFRNLTGE